MSKLVKGMIIDELKERYSDLDSALWVQFQDCDGNTTNEFRGVLRKANMHVQIVKNTLFRKAVEESPLAPLGDKLTGPSAIVFGGESVIDVAKVIEDWVDKIEGLEMRAAVLEGEFIGPDRIEQLSKMPTKRDLQAKIAGAIIGPASTLSGAIIGPFRSIAGCIKAIETKLEDGETIAKVG